LQLSYRARCESVVTKGLFDLMTRVQNRAMVAAAEIGANLPKGQSGDLASEVHANLARPEDVPRALCRPQLPGWHAEVSANPLGDPLHGWLGGLGFFLKMAGNGSHIQLAVAAGKHFKAIESALELSPAAGQVFRQPGEDLLADRQLPALGLGLQQC
jgi:hypothetical protein